LRNVATAAEILEIRWKMPQTESQRKSKKLITTINDEAERKRGEKLLDEAIENTFPCPFRKFHPA